MVMNDMLRKLPIGIQTFEDIRTDNYLYVDKTALVWKIANSLTSLAAPVASARACCFLLLRLISAEESMFNPFSVLNAFSNMELGSYWFQTGTPTFLVEMLQKTEYDLRTLLDGIEAPASVFSEYRVDSNNPIPLIYQSGYLTIKGFDERFRNYLLEFPNDEVRYGFVDFLVP